MLKPFLNVSIYNLAVLNKPGKVSQLEATEARKYLQAVTDFLCLYAYHTAMKIKH